MNSSTSKSWCIMKGPLPFRMLAPAGSSSPKHQTRAACLQRLRTPPFMSVVFCFITNQMHTIYHVKHPLKIPYLRIPFAIIFFWRCFLYSVIVPSHLRTVLCSHTMMSFAILSSNLKGISNGP